MTTPTSLPRRTFTLRLIICAGAVLLYLGFARQLDFQGEMNPAPPASQYAKANDDYWFRDLNGAASPTPPPAMAWRCECGRGSRAASTPDIGD